MNDKTNKTLYKKCKSKHLSFKHACEVGVYLPQTSNIIDFINDNIPTTLVEPDPKNIKAIKEYFKDLTNITLFPFAVFDYNGTLELVQREASTYVGSLKASPSLVNDHYIPDEKDKFTVECRKFDEMDDGTIDLLSVDTEGCEWYVIQNLKSRPQVISIETHGKSYINSFYKEISLWMEQNNYIPWYKDNSDTVYIKEELFGLTLNEKLSLKIKDFMLSFRRLKLRIKQRIIGSEKK
jgi:FkbM family methyltransferase